MKNQGVVVTRKAHVPKPAGLRSQLVTHGTSWELTVNDRTGTFEIGSVWKVGHYLTWKEVSLDVGRCACYNPGEPIIKAAMAFPCPGLSTAQPSRALRQIPPLTVLPELSLLLECVL